jgi:hypothetical protein
MNATMMNPVMNPMTIECNHNERILKNPTMVDECNPMMVDEFNDDKSNNKSNNNWMQSQ